MTDEMQSHHVQLIGGHSDGATLLIATMVPRIDCRPKTRPDKPNIYCLTGARAANGDLLYVHEDILNAWSKGRRDR